MVKAIVGACWGDEGKGKITDVLAEDSDIVIRFQGGSNAGHTIINEHGRFALHQLPSGVFRQNITNIIGNGVAFSVENFVKEMQYIRDGGVPEPRILISERCQVLMPYHKELDGLEEARLADKAYGSTKSGIAPFYSDKYAKIGFQISDLFDDKDAIYERIDHVLGLKNVLYRELYHKEPLNRDDIYNKLMEYKEIVAPYVADTTTLLYNAVKEGKTILLEGQLGSLRDPDMGIYPMTTSSSPLAGFGAVGAGGIPPYAIEKIYCVVKAYSSAVGAGISSRYPKASSTVRATSVAPWTLQPYRAATKSSQPTCRGRPVVAPYSPLSPPRFLSSSASSPKISETNSPAPTALEYAFTTQYIFSMA